MPILADCKVNDNLTVIGPSGYKFAALNEKLMQKQH